MNSIIWFGTGVAIGALIYTAGYQMGKIMGLRNYLRYLGQKRRMIRLEKALQMEGWDYKPQQRDGRDGS